MAHDIDTSIMTIATPKIDNPARGPYVTDKPIPIFLDAEHGGEDMRGLEGKALYFEQAGPRDHIYFDPDKTKIAIVTCGGLCPGLNDVIRAIVMEAHYSYGVRSLTGIRYGLEGFIPRYHHDIVELTPSWVSDIHTFGGTILGSSRGPQESEEIVDALERMNVNILFVIGGDGSMKAAAAIQNEVFKRKLRISVIGIPKTIDNDINFIPRSFGFDTAVDVATMSLRCAHTEAIGACNGIGLVKLMGRESGFIAAQATLALNVVNFVLIPEAPFHLEGEGGLLPALEARLRSRNHAVIVVAEGAGQDLLTSNGKTDASGNRVLGDIGHFLQNAINTYFAKKDMSISLKYIDPSYLVRSTPANTTDRIYCGQLGRNAVHAAMTGRTNMVVACLLDHYVHLPLELVTRRRRKIDIRSEYWRSVLASTGQHLA
ncbi:ATP-dependent 6-phosphofructokinase [uncultured Mailhella sp.]|uniref:ATP-dependent 6-phosphofructokinase n=1 Tax=uncultured Mailhella sp. TaxID=1981031 RepID=UPI00260FC421|nr:ATP-dependent 6-phosphofructokinase [uncultured Mailhella sp.]